LSDTYGNAVDAFRDVGERIPLDLASALVPSNLPRPDDVLERVADEGRRIGSKNLMIAGGALALVLAVVWVVRRRRSRSDTHDLRVADSRHAAA
jgi:hypothetical protein